MDQPGVLEVIVCSQADALAAAAGGADRLEVIRHYEVGGLTPTTELVRSIAEAVELPLRVMLRESVPFAVSDQAEVSALCSAARELAELAIDGLVMGFLRESPESKRIDDELLKRVLACAPRVKATFHRAFEELQDPLQAIAELKRFTQIDRILTSGGRDGLADKARRLRELREAAQGEIELVIGGGTDAETIRALRPVGIREFHVGRAVRADRKIDGAVLVDRVRELADLVHF